MRQCDADWLALCHTQPRITVLDGQIVFLVADNRRPLLVRLCSSLLKFRWSSVMVFPAQKISSASFAITPSSSRSPNTRHRSSSSAVSEPIGQRAYTLKWWQGRSTSWHSATVESDRERWIDRWILCVSTARFYVGCCLRQPWERAVTCCNDQHLWMLSLVCSPLCVSWLEPTLMGTSSGRTNTPIDTSSSNLFCSSTCWLRAYCGRCPFRCQGSTGLKLTTASKGPTFPLYPR